MTELRCLYAPAGPDCDVVFVHGLGGDLMETWDVPTSWVPWLSRDFPSTQVWTLGYDASPTAWFGGHSMPLQDRAVNLLAELNGYGLGDRRPLVLICHSLGGLLAKQILRIGDGSARQFQNTARAIAGVAFLATPHTGASLPVIADYLRALTRRTVAIADLQENAAVLRDLNTWFRDRYSRAQIPMRVFFETRETAGFRIVSENSADPGIAGVEPIPIDANHISICKPTAPDLVYRQIVFMLREVMGASVPRDCESTLRRQLLVTADPGEIQRIKFELEALLKREPTSPFSAHQLLSQAQGALDYARPLANPPSPPSRDLRFRRVLQAATAFAAVAVLAIGTFVAHLTGKKSEPEAVPGIPIGVPPPHSASHSERLAVVHITLGRQLNADKTVSAPTTVFKRRDTIYAAVSTRGSAAAAVLGARWTFGASQLVYESSLAIAPTGPTVTEFHINKADGWPLGTYHVEITLNGVPSGLESFEVR